MPAVGRYGNILRVAGSCYWNVGKKGHITNGRTSEQPGRKLKSWQSGEASIYSTELTHRNCVTACCHRSRGAKGSERLERCLFGTSGMDIFNCWTLKLMEGVWLPSDFLLQ